MEPPQPFLFLLLPNLDADPISYRSQVQPQSPALPLAPLPARWGYFTSASHTIAGRQPED
jgi:hypothetical protein